MARFHWTGLPVGVCITMMVLAACGTESRDEMSWARAALERNNDIDVVAADQQSRTFTVRLKSTGELRVVRADDVMAAPPPAASAAASGATSPAPTSLSAPAPAAAPSPGEVARSANEGAQSTGEGAQEAAPGEPRPSTPPSSILPQNAPTAEAASGKVLESGPGYTIKAASAATPAASGRVRESSVTNAALERRHEPIICQGARMMQIDNRNLAFDGDAVSAEDGCEIHITNSHISAGGVGVQARAANVYIDNSLIEGEQASIDESAGAQVYATASRFRGLSRRLDTASFHDLGGNVWN